MYNSHSAPYNVLTDSQWGRAGGQGQLGPERGSGPGLRKVESGGIMGETGRFLVIRPGVMGNCYGQLKRPACCKEVQKFLILPETFKIFFNFNGYFSSEMFNFPKQSICLNR